MTVIDILQERGFIENRTHESELDDYVQSGSITCYIGFDPTANSFHVGSLVPIMALSHMQRCGHRPIALVGGGTGLIGDPSGKTEMRKMLTYEEVEENASALKRQLEKFIDFSNQKALLLNNAEWLTKLGYIELLRDIGRHFNVNKMIKAESCKSRMESDEGLSFIEFNYTVLQAYDFLKLFDVYDCRLQMGGSDQWGNIISGVELIRKMRQQTAFGLTFPLITTSSGAKMGKTAQGAVWLDPNKTSPYDYYQFWINTDDRDVIRFLSLFTFIPMDEIRSVKNLEGADLNHVKSILAFEATAIVHGIEEAVKAFRASSSMFGLRTIPDTIIPSSKIPRFDATQDGDSVPTSILDKKLLEEGVPAFKIFLLAGLSPSGSEARRLIQQGGAYINNQRIDVPDLLITEDYIHGNDALLRAGKKKYHRIIFK